MLTGILIGIVATVAFVAIFLKVGVSLEQVPEEDSKQPTFSKAISKSASDEVARVSKDPNWRIKAELEFRNWRGGGSQTGVA